MFVHVHLHGTMKRRSLPPSLRSDLVSDRTQSPPETTAPPADDPPGRQPETAGPPGTLWARMKADPEYAPEHLALEAVRRLGPQARSWAARLRSERPDLGPDAMAQLAIRRFTHQARLSGAISGAVGLPGAVVDVGLLAWTQARMVLHVAAAHGLDPTHPARATDLLLLQRVHRIAESARLALGVAAGRERASRIFEGVTDRPLTGAILRLGAKLAQMAGVKATKRMFVKIIPGAGVILGTWANSTATTRLARRAREHYSQGH
ncbi:hypothetical protein KRM28CT15_49710 [Krasilnikovia sp. M28-CT-15]